MTTTTLDTNLQEQLAKKYLILTYAMTDVLSQENFEEYLSLSTERQEVIDQIKNVALCATAKELFQKALREEQRHTDLFRQYQTWHAKQSHQLHKTAKANTAYQRNTDHL